MQVHRSLEKLPTFKKAVITIGTFDGVHLGHLELIEAVCAEARSAGGESLLVSFHPHPRSVINRDTKVELLNTPEEKIGLMEKTGIDHLVIVPFDESFANLSAQDYIEQFLLKRFQPHAIVIGYDHHFGKGRKGNYALLQEMSQTLGYKLIEIPARVLQSISVSSTQIREALRKGEVDLANNLLGYDFSFEGVVVRGDALGRILGYPTANLIYTHAEKIHLGHGVYIAEAKLGEEKFQGMLSIGTRPTLNDEEEKVELYLFNFDRNIYGEKLKVSVLHRLRGQEKFNSLEELKIQMKKDEDESRSWLASGSNHSDH